MGSCTAWEIDEACCSLPDGESIDPTWQQVASDILWYASGMRYGTCPVTLVSPCVRRCGGGSGVWMPYKDGGGEWRNLSTCGCVGDCSCVEISEITLPGPVASVTTVMIGDTELDPSNYRLDKVGDGWRLLRTDGAAWPDCSDPTVDCGEPDSFCITYEQGIALDALATAAVSQAACQLTLACLDDCDACELPANVVSVVRRGVGINLEVVKSAVLALPLVASWIAAVNPNGLQSASTVWSPDIARVRTTPAIEVS